jgi:2-methylisocitrate lyase-like PEP mutase family enzyme
LKRLKELGVARVSTPRMLPAAALSGMRKALEVMKECIVTGEPADRPDLLASMEDITSLFDYERISALESEFTAEEDLDRKYRDDKRSFVVRAEGSR